MAKFMYGLPLLRSSFDPARLVGGIGLGAVLTSLTLQIYQAEAIPAILFYWFLATIVDNNFQVGFGSGIHLGTILYIGYLSINYPSSVFVSNISTGTLIPLLLALTVIIYASTWFIFFMKRLITATIPTMLKRCKI